MRRPSFEEMSAIINGTVRGTVAPDSIPWDDFDERSRQEIRMLILYEIRRLSEIRESRRRGRDPSQKRALELLKTFLNPDQLRTLEANGKNFRVQGTMGGTYRLWPRRGLAEKIVWRRKKWFLEMSCCYHDPEKSLPPADVTIAQLLLIRTDEMEFLRSSNHTRTRLGQNLVQINAWRSTERRAFALEI